MRNHQLTEILKMTVCLGAFAAACETGPGLDPNVVGMDRTYHLSDCRTSGKTTPPPCTSFFSASTQTAIYVADLTFKRDHSMTWVVGTTTTFNSCHETGQQCVAESSSLNSSPGTYQIVGNAIVVQLQNPGSFSSPLSLSIDTPTHVDADWLGPDALSLSMQSGAYLATLRP